MTEVEALSNRLAATERRVNVLTAVAIVMGAAGLIAATHPRSDVLRAQGLVITDAAGRERIILGAPMGGVTPNVTLAGAVGLVVLDSASRLHVAVGTNNPLVLGGGRTGTRIASSAGLTIYDPRNGQERGGIGAFADGRANVCLDYAGKSKEAACMAVAPNDQYAAVILNGTPSEPQFDRVTMYVGADGAGSIKAFGGGGNNGGVMIRAGKGQPSVTVYDTTGKAIGTLTPSRP